ncbi:MAG: DUF3866 family protein [Mycobacteriales bacterium]
MIRWRRGEVSDVRREWAGALELTVRCADGDVRALAYPDLVGRPELGEEVLLNVNALALGLGTGGYAVVVAVPGRLPPDAESPGHLMKARYTPLQSAVLGVDEPASPHHPLVRDLDSLDGLPVVVADLHSALAAVIAGIHADRPAARVAYVMTDGGALPIAFSQAVAGLVAAGALVGTVTVGQAYGGDLEAVTLHTGLLAASAVLRADVVVVTQGPGNLGTATPWGFSGVAAGEAVNAISVLGGRPVACLRVSAADPRERHRGVSHHSMTAYGRVALAAADIVVPLLDESLLAVVRADLAGLAGRHRLVDVSLDGLPAALARSPVDLSTMGRSLADDPAYFLAAAAAGRHAASLLAD